MSIVVCLRVAPAQGRVLTPGKIVSLVEGLLDQDLVLPQFRLVRGEGLLDEDLWLSKLLPTLYPKRDKPPRGTKSVYDGDNTAALLTALNGCDLERQAVSVGFGPLNWNAEKTRQGFYYPGESLILFSSPNQEITFEEPDFPTVLRTARRRWRRSRQNLCDAFILPDRRTYVLSKARLRAVDALRFRQCLILAGQDPLAGLLCDELRGSEVQRFVEKHFGSPLQVCESYS
jgi:hypothetical protein